MPSKHYPYTVAELEAKLAALEAEPSIRQSRAESVLVLVHALYLAQQVDFLEFQVHTLAARIDSLTSKD